MRETGPSPKQARAQNRPEPETDLSTKLTGARNWPEPETGPSPKQARAQNRPEPETGLSPKLT
jgi:hypothetical protein